ncbi:uncharacterized protein [Blastocystis hominis]|uniref:RecA family profile 1 domain-containing protein n=1 Tax=Blastocystis hominis TaxID=12968 RepID=D8M5Y2_BLAHO|nr:uncharacterized protein [Blastocystis hominis]CBK23581.2 unnamed protein product [Blastocystis hominis]|eukprot:XP_012897629.1 uncharacterized protein [Blastocystis hominis]
MVDIREFSDAIDALPPSEFRKALKAFVVKGKGPVPTRFPHEGKRSLRDFVDLAAKEKEVGIEQAVSAVLNQEIESPFVNVRWSEIAALNETQRQFALFVLQMEAAMHSFVEVQIERRIDEELDLGPLEEKTLDVMEDVISILYSLSASPRRREEIRRLQEQCYCTIWHVCFKEMSAILEQCQTAEELLQQQQTAFLTTGCRSIDKCLKGGIPLHSITEITGESSSGKSQLAIQLAVNCILSEKDRGVNGKALYIDTESSFSTQRLADISNAFCSRHPEFSIDQISENIFIENKVRSYEDLVSLLDSLEDRLKNPSNSAIRVVIIDSITSLFRGSGTTVLEG